MYGISTILDWGFREKSKKKHAKTKTYHRMFTNEHEWRNSCLLFRASLHVSSYRCYTIVMKRFGADFSITLCNMRYVIIFMILAIKYSIIHLRNTCCYGNYYTCAALPHTPIKILVAQINIYFLLSHFWIPSLTSSCWALIYLTPLEVLIEHD
jgi:hypothetical protein